MADDAHLAVDGVAELAAEHLAASMRYLIAGLQLLGTHRTPAMDNMLRRLTAAMAAYDAEGQDDATR